MNKQLHGLYVLTDHRVPFKQWLQTAEECLRGGTKIIQLREKTHEDTALLDIATALQELCRDYQALFIVNDRISLAKTIDADGVHIGAKDEKPDQVRNYLGKNKIIGVSCYNQLQRAYTAQQQDADYVAFGSVFRSTTKPDTVNVSFHIIAQAVDNLSIPVCAIGGITPANAAELVQLGVSMLAVSEAVFAAKNPAVAAQEISSLL